MVDDDDGDDRCSVSLRFNLSEELLQLTLAAIDNDATCSAFLFYFKFFSVLSFRPDHIALLS